MIIIKRSRESSAAQYVRACLSTVRDMQEIARIRSRFGLGRAHVDKQIHPGMVAHANSLAFERGGAVNPQYSLYVHAVEPRSTCFQRPP